MGDRGKDAADGEISAHLDTRKQKRDYGVVVAKSKHSGGLAWDRTLTLPLRVYVSLHWSSLLVNRLMSVMGEEHGQMLPIITIPII